MIFVFDDVVEIGLDAPLIRHGENITHESRHAICTVLYIQGNVPQGPGKHLHCKKRLDIFPSPAGISPPCQGEFGIVTIRLGTGKSLTFFYCVRFIS
jgi:hypothetical protein